MSGIFARTYFRVTCSIQRNRFECKQRRPKREMHSHIVEPSNKSVPNWIDNWNLSVPSTPIFSNKILPRNVTEKLELRIRSEIRFGPTHRNELFLFEKTQSNIAPNLRTFLPIRIDQFVFIQGAVDIILWLWKMSKNIRWVDLSYGYWKSSTCKIDPKASNAFEQFSSVFVTSKSLSNAPFVSFIRKYKIPISVSTSILSLVILPIKFLIQCRTGFYIH